METVKKPIYPLESWHITETSFLLENNYRNETAFALSNGYIGTRGTFEEGYDFSIDEGLEGNFLSGFYESEEIRYGEWNFGFPKTSQSLLNLPNAKTIHLFLDEEPFDLREGTTKNYRRSLHMQDGTLTRTLEWTSPKGKKIQLETTRFVSFSNKHSMVQRYCVTPLNFSGLLRLTSVLDGDVENHTRKTNPLVDYGPFGRSMILDELVAGDEQLFYRGHATNSNLSMACGSLHKLNIPAKASYKEQAFSCQMEYTVQAICCEPVILEKQIAYTSSIDMAAEDMKTFIRTTLFDAQKTGFDKLLAAQKSYTHRFWESADVQIVGDEAVQQGMRFNLFHILQAVGREGKSGMGAKGLSGEGYEGHCFWDTETYVLPVFTFTFPEIAKSMLDFRYSTLDAARARARELGHPIGALYPWRTINGHEASTYFPLGTAQYHINADIALAFWQYVEVSGDTDYLKTHAAEVLCETARVWADVGSFAECRNGKYCICAVTGPNEYNAIVDNNFYTNLMARENLRNALKSVEWLKKNDVDAYKNLADKINLSKDELTLWRKIEENMYFPYDEERKIFLQDDGFMMRKPRDPNRFSPEKRELLYEHYHPLFVWRQRMAKQADTVLGMYLLSHYFNKEELQRNYDFYQDVTLHHSSLSTCIFGIVACQIGYHDEAYGYFMESARMDLDDYHNNFYAGIHGANMAGTWQAIANGFGGLRTNNGILEMNPILPVKWQGYTFRGWYQGSQMEICVTQSGSEVRLLKGPGVTFTLLGAECHLKAVGDSVLRKA